MSGAVGSRPSLTRSGRPSFAACASLRSRPPAGSAAAAFRCRNAASTAGELTTPMLDSRRAAEPVVTAVGRGRQCASSAAPPTARGLRSWPGRMTHARQPNITPPFADDPPPDAAPRVNKVRLLAVLVPLVALAVVSTVFGMMMAVASDLPDLENRREYQNARNSLLVDVHGQALGVLTNNQARILVAFDDIAPVVRNAVIAIEDRRFYENSGVDLKGIARALAQDIVHQRAAQGGSTITQQFVKNALRAQNDRTVLQKMREAALAYHLTRKWSKAKILTQYLNSIYFGNGAYGIESAARTYFGKDHP